MFVLYSNNYYVLVASSNVCIIQQYVLVAAILLEATVTNPTSVCECCYISCMLLWRMLCVHCRCNTGWSGSLCTECVTSSGCGQYTHCHFIHIHTLTHSLQFKEHVLYQDNVTAMLIGAESTVILVSSACSHNGCIVTASHYSCRPDPLSEPVAMPTWCHMLQHWRRDLPMLLCTWLLWHQL